MGLPDCCCAATLRQDHKDGLLHVILYTGMYDIRTSKAGGHAVAHDWLVSACQEGRFLV